MQAQGDLSLGKGSPPTQKGNIMINPNATVDSLNILDAVWTMLDRNLLVVTGDYTEGIYQGRFDTFDSELIALSSYANNHQTYFFSRENIRKSKVVGASLFAKNTEGNEFQIGFIPDNLIILEKL
jgi:hypothetical protein